MGRALKDCGVIHNGGAERVLPLPFVCFPLQVRPYTFALALGSDGLLLEGNSSHIGFWTETGAVMGLRNTMAPTVCLEYGCCQKNNKSFVPTRLIDVSTKEDDVSRLVELTGYGTSVTCVKLSPCWRSGLPFKETKNR